MRVISQRELRNDITRVLREVEAGETMQVTVRGRVVGELGPARRHGLTARARVAELLRKPADASWLDELLAERRAAEREERDHWS
jgi:antitoxin (DNA-binding transcriptional repressor) of toxin-antitoxin stability system